MTTVEIQVKLKQLGKNQAYLSKLFNRSPAQISNAIKTDSYPRLKTKIINHIEKLERKK